VRRGTSLQDARSFEAGYMAARSLQQLGLDVQPTALVVSFRDS
jgi:hypothetical protein